MREQNIICTVCPMGCHITVKGEGENIVSVEGNTCPRGEQYARDEFICPVRILTTSVRVKGAQEPLLAARSSKPIPKDKLFECMEIVRKQVYTAPIKTHDVLIPNILDTGADLIACADTDVI